MKKIEAKKTKCLFLYVEPGDMFEDCNGNVYMKILEIDYKTHNSIHKVHKANAISLGDSTLYCFEDNYYVTLLQFLFTKE